jgi:hypothetical protein
MPYTLITPTGKIYTFYSQVLADTYKNAYGGVVITQQILVDDSAQTVYN